MEFICCGIFFSFLWCEVKLSIWTFTSFLMQTCSAINIPLSVCYVLEALYSLHFHFIWKTLFHLFLKFVLWQKLFYRMLLSFQIMSFSCPLSNYYRHDMTMWKYSWNNFYFCIIVGIQIVPNSVFNLGEYLKYSGKDRRFSFWGVLFLVL